MIEFILLNILFISISGILIIFAKTLPRIEDEPNEDKLSFWEKFIVSDLPHKVDQAINFYTNKILRRLKVLVLRLDNYLTYKLKSLTPNGEEKKISFEELTKNQKEDSNQN